MEFFVACMELKQSTLSNDQKDASMSSSFPMYTEIYMHIASIIFALPYNRSN